MATKNTISDFASLAYAVARQATLFLWVTLLPFVLLNVFITLPTDYLTSLYGNLNAVFFTGLTLYLALVYWAPSGLEKAADMLKVRGAKMCSTIFGLISVAMLAAWIFIAYSAYFSDTLGDATITLLFFGANIAVATVLTRYFWRGLIQTKRHESIVEQLWSVVDRGVAIYRRLVRAK